MKKLLFAVILGLFVKSSAASSSFLVTCGSENHEIKTIQLNPAANIKWKAVFKRLTGSGSDARIDTYFVSISCKKGNTYTTVTIYFEHTGEEKETDFNQIMSF